MCFCKQSTTCFCKPYEKFMLPSSDSKAEDDSFYLLIFKLGKNLRQRASWDNEIFKTWIFTEVIFVCSFQLFYFSVFRMHLDHTFHFVSKIIRQKLFFISQWKNKNLYPMTRHQELCFTKDQILWISEYRKE